MSRARLTLTLSSRTCLLVAIALLVVLAPAAWAQEHEVRKLESYREVSPYYEIPTLTTGFISFTPETEVDLGFTRLHGFLGERILIDDNIYLSENDRKSDVIFLTTPGLLAESFLDDHRLRLSYSPTLRNYVDESKLNAWEHDASLDLRLDFVDAYVRLADELHRTQDARDIIDRGSVDRTTNRLQGEGGILVGDYGVGVRGQWMRRSYGREVPSFEDLDEFQVGVFGRWAPTVDYAWLLEYEYLHRDFAGHVLNDSRTQSILGGWEGSPQEDVNLLAKAGLVWLHADDSGTVGDDDDLFDLELEAQVNLRLRNDLGASFFYVQRPEYASFSNFQKVYRGGTNLSWDLDPGWITVRGSLYLERANPSNEPSLSLIAAGIAVDANVTPYMKAGLGFERRNRLGEGELDYTVNQVYLQAVIYF